MVIINTNTEMLIPIWSDLFEDTILDVTWIENDDISNYYVKVFTEKLNELNIDYEYESSFSYWNGGPGVGFYKEKKNEYNDDISIAYDYACDKTREYTQKLIKEILS